MVQRPHAAHLPAIDAAPAAPAPAAGFRRLWDDFSDGFSVGTPGSPARWFHPPLGAPGAPITPDDGHVSAGPTARAGLRVISHRDPLSGQPAFRHTVEQGPAGLLDCLKWLACANHLASSGLPGFDALVGQELRFEAHVGARTFGADRHPFGAAVTDPDADLRLAGAGLAVVDFESMLVVDFMLTNRRLYAFYERPPVARTPERPYAAFLYAIPLAERRPEQEHALAIAYDRRAGRVRWLIDGQEHFRVDRLGRHLDRRHMLVDHGGDEETIIPRQLTGGLGLFSFLDGAGPDGQGLVRLSSLPDFYFDPRTGPPAPARFVDEASAPRSRLFGQGAELRVRDFVVASRPLA